MSTDISFYPGKRLYSFDVCFSIPLFALNNNQYILPANIAADANIYLSAPLRILARDSLISRHDAAALVESSLKSSNYGLKLFPRYSACH